jgi:fimbrial chaperone protein
VVRLAMVKPSASAKQVTYRLFIREIVEARPAEKNLEVNIALAFSLPVFITPPGAKNDLACDAVRAAADRVSVRCTNNGAAHALIREIALDRGTMRLAGRDAGGYILSGIRRAFELKRVDGQIPSGPAKLAVTLDDGSTRTFDVAISE